MDNPYAVLGISRSASPEEIKRAYFDLVRKHPPERDPQGFKRIRLAYDSLKDSDKRSQTDLFLMNDPYGEFNLIKEENFKYDRELDIKIAVYSFSDIGKKDFREDFNEISEGLD